MNIDPKALELAGAAFELEAEAELLKGLVDRLRKLQKQQHLTGKSWEADWPDEIQIPISEVNDKHSSSQTVFHRHAALYSQCADDWPADLKHYDSNDLTAGLIRQYREKFQLLEKCAGIVRTKAKLMLPVGAGPVINNIANLESLAMGDSYSNSGQAGAMGPNAHVHDVVFNQGGPFHADNLPALAAELDQLRRALKDKSSTVADDAATGKIAAAQVAAEAGDGKGALESLKAAGKWALDVAKDIGVKIAVGALEQSLGMKA